MIRGAIADVLLVAALFLAGVVFLRETLTFLMEVPL